MEKIINIHVEKLPEGFYLGTSDDIQGLVSQGRTVVETMEIARDVAGRLLEAQSSRKKSLKLPQVKKSFDLQLVVASRYGTVGRIEVSRDNPNALTSSYSIARPQAAMKCDLMQSQIATPRFRTILVICPRVH